MVVSGKQANKIAAKRRKLGSKLLADPTASEPTKVRLPAKQRAVKETVLMLQSRQMLARSEVGELWITAGASLQVSDGPTLGRRAKPSAKALKPRLATWKLMPLGRCYVSPEKPCMATVKEQQLKERPLVAPSLKAASLKVVG